MSSTGEPGKARVRITPDCTEEDRHARQRKARTDLELVVLDYADAHNLSPVDMAHALSSILHTVLATVSRDDEELRTGHRHRLAGE